MNACNAMNAHSRHLALDSLNDDLLSCIFDAIAGEIRYGEAERDERSFQRRPTAIASLRALRLVNKRLSRIAQLVLFRAPNTLTRAQGPLTCDNLRILLHPPVVEGAQLLSLAGSVDFFTGILEDRYRKVTSLTLILTHPNALSVDIGNEDVDIDMLDELPKSNKVVRLCSVLRALPLQELRLYVHKNMEISRTALFKGILRAAGHPSLSHLSVTKEDSHHRWSRPLEELALPLQLRTAIRSLTVRGISVAEVVELRDSLGGMPDLVKVTLMDNGVPLLGPIFGMEDRLRSLDFGDLHVPPHTDFGSGLARFQNLETLSISIRGGLTEETFFTVALPKLSRLTVKGPNAYKTNAVIFVWAARRDLLPSLESIRVFTLDGWMTRIAFEPARAMVWALDRLEALRPNVRVLPEGLSAWTIQQIVAYTGDNDSEYGDRDSVCNPTHSEPESELPEYINHSSQDGSASDGDNDMHPDAVDAEEEDGYTS